MITSSNFVQAMKGHSCLKIFRDSFVGAIVSKLSLYSGTKRKDALSRIEMSLRTAAKDIKKIHKSIDSGTGLFILCSVSPDLNRTYVEFCQSWAKLEHQLKGVEPLVNRLQDENHQMEDGTALDSYTYGGIPFSGTTDEIKNMLTKKLSAPAPLPTAGWLSPQGVFTPCAYMGHTSSAQSISSKSGLSAELDLLQTGYGKLALGEWFVNGSWTARQKAFIHDNCGKSYSGSIPEHLYGE